jgi:hypothetical protein
MDEVSIFATQSIYTRPPKSDYTRSDSSWRAGAVGRDTAALDLYGGGLPGCTRFGARVETMSVEATQSDAALNARSIERLTGCSRNWQRAMRIRAKDAACKQRSSGGEATHPVHTQCDYCYKCPCLLDIN